MADNASDYNNSLLPVQPLVCNYSINPWCGQFGLRQYFEVIFLLFLSGAGVFGNLLVIFSIYLDGKCHKQGNLFIMNLSAADIIVRSKLFYIWVYSFS